MEENKIPFTENIYEEHLAAINGINFTPREIAVIACLLHARGTSRIASFLSIAPRTVVTHIRNIMLKLECNSRESIIDFIEKSQKIPTLRTYYERLVVESAFDKSLHEISKLRHEGSRGYILAYWTSQNLKTALMQRLTNHLNRAHLHTEVREQRLDQKVESSENLDHALLLLLEKKDQQEVPEEFLIFDSIDLSEQKNYYFAVFEILKKLLPNVNLENIITNFRERSAGMNMTPPQGSLKREKENVFNDKKTNITILPRRSDQFIQKRFWFLIGSTLTIVFLVAGILSVKDRDPKKPEEIVRSDLIVPVESVLLQRPELMTQIKDKFKKQRGNIQTIALVGPGGAGKTTVARQYARSQKLPIVWEINSETQESLMRAFENLAYALAKKKEDQKILREIQDIKDFPERKEKIFYFIKERLKLHGPWLLIYDNVENFSDIQKYFPQDINTWGEGKIILTTRNSNIHNNVSIDHIIHLKELNKDQKLTLFTKILNQEKNGRNAGNDTKEIKEFLEKIPPFPLDISVAAYYLKTANIPYAKYLERLNQDDKSVTNIQETLLKEAGEYTKTRYSITNLSLKQLVEAHKDFRDLLLFITLLDSQNIPRELLERLKNDIVVDNFIYHLKKYSLITSDSSMSSVGSTLSIHRSTQAIALAYLIKTMDLEKRNHSITNIIGILKNYMREARDQEKFSTAKCLLTHCEAFLSHKKLFSDAFNGIINGELGGVYLLLSDYINAEKYLKQSLSILENLTRKDPRLLFRPFSYLGAFYWSIGEVTKARTLLEKSIEVYKKFEIADDDGICKTLTWAGMSLANQNDVQKAKNLFTEAIKIYEKSPSKNYQGLASSLMNLGNLYRRLGEYNQAKFHLQKSVALSEKYLTDNNPTLGEALGYLGWLYSDLGYIEKAKNLHERVLFIFKQYYPYNNPEVAWALSNLGDAYNDMGDYQKAQIFLNQSLVILKKTLGEDNIRTAWALFQLGKVYINLGHIEIARNILEDCLVVYKKNNNRTSNVLKALGGLYLLEKNLEKAEDFLNKALKTFRNDKSPLEYECLEIFSELHLKKSQEAIKSSKLKEAEHFKTQAMNDLKQALEIVKTRFPADSPHIARIQDKIKKLSFSP